MTLNEAIKHCYEVANRKCDDCGKEHLQLAKWLEELQNFKNKSDFVKVVQCENCEFKQDCNKEIYLEGSYCSVTFCSNGRKKKEV